MRQVSLAHPSDFLGWREKARILLNENIPPEKIVWLAHNQSLDLFGDSSAVTTELPITKASKPESGFKVPGAFMTLAEYVSCHRDENRFALLYRVLWRVTHGEKNVLQNPCDDDIYRLEGLRRAISRDRHKMTAFVRFRKLAEPRIPCDNSSREHYISWFEPDHHILRLTSDFFVKRFTNMNWSIYTPDESAHWNGTSIVFSKGSSKDSLPDAENMDDLWRTYFANIYNPARVRIKAMQSEMPVKYWKNLPEAQLIASLIHESDSRTTQMIERPATTAPKFAAKAEFQIFGHGVRGDSGVPQTLEELDSQIQQCQRCDHACLATQAVVGSFAIDFIVKKPLQSFEEPRQTNVHSNEVVMLVGGQPGDKEDLTGSPFVDPAGALLKEILAEMQLDFNRIYFTNAVKHFKYTVKRKERIHQQPHESDIYQCREWLFEEIRLVRPKRIIALGNTAAKALTGQTTKLDEVMGKWTRVADSIPLLITAHPSAVLRSKEQRSRLNARQILKSDLERAFLTEAQAMEEQVSN